MSQAGGPEHDDPRGLPTPEQVVDLVRDEAGGQANPLLGDFAAVDWVQQDRIRGPITWRDATWTAWQKRTGEWPPDFLTMRSEPLLPDPLMLDHAGERIGVTTPELWARKRAWIAEQTRHWISGQFPPPPENLVAEVLEERVEAGTLFRRVRLAFGPERRATLTLDLTIPPGTGRRPVLMTPGNPHWVQAAARRGYVGCVYAAHDRQDDTEAYGPRYPDFDFGRLMRRAWGAGRAIDYLVGLPEIDPARIALVGHSRNAKQALLAAAFDERIAAVIPSSGGTMGLDAIRFSDGRFGHQSVDEITHAFPSWFVPRLRFFIGNEDRLPIDLNLVLAMVAPRALMMTSAIREIDGSPWGIEEVWRSVARVYDLLGAKDRLTLRHRHGRHAVPAEEFEAYLDFFDTVFGRSAAYHFLDYAYFPYRFERWREIAGERIDPHAFPEARAAVPDEARRQLGWLLGERPPHQYENATATVEAGPGLDTWRVNSQADELLPFDAPKPRAVTRERLLVGPLDLGGEALRAWLYRPSGEPPAAGWPVAVYLHPLSHATGFLLRAGPVIEPLVQRGVAVVTLDLLGFHTRIEEGRAFDERCPRWSRMGKMLLELRALMAAIGTLDFLDRRRIAMLGASLGGTVALLAAATDERIAAVAACNAVTPWRARSGEGLRAYSHLHGLIPRLGLFLGHEERIPVDFGDLLPCIAPRPMLLIASRFDRNAAGVEACVARARQAYADAPSAFAFERPLNIARCTRAQKRRMIDFVAQALNNAAKTPQENP